MKEKQINKQTQTMINSYLMYCLGVFQSTAVAIIFRFSASVFLYVCKPPEKIITVHKKQLNVSSNYGYIKHKP